VDILWLVGLGGCLDYQRLDLFTFIDKMLVPCVTSPLPPIMTLRTGNPVLGSTFKGASLIFCSTSNRRGLAFGFRGMVS
jgi:hypothetical protein